MIKIISAVEKETFAIGKNNDLLYNIPADLKRFKELTSGNKVLMGLNTLRSLPKGPLPNRINIVLVPEIPNETYENVIWVTSIDDAINTANTINPEQDTYIIGGGMVYKQFIPYADEVTLTEIYPINGELHYDADVFFPKEDFLNRFKEINIPSDGYIYIDKSGNKFEYFFRTYIPK